MSADSSNVAADEIFKEFKEHSIAAFFKKNRQMLGYAGKVRSLTMLVHEYVTNSIDACEEAGILPEISAEIKQTGEDKYSIMVSDNGPGIPKTLAGKALGSVLSGTKFHRYVQQRGQQGIGASGCTLFANITTNKPIHVKSSTGRDAFECDVSIDIKSNKPLVSNVADVPRDFRGLIVEGEFGSVKYENSDHGVYEYLKRTALANPHASITLTDPTGKQYLFPRSDSSMPKKPKAVKPHPMGLESSDLIDFAHVSASRKVSSFLTESFSRVSHDKVDELKKIATGVDFEKDPKTLTWADAEELVKAFSKVKWMAPETDSISPIGKKQVEAAIKNILNPGFASVAERKPAVFRGGIPFVVEAGIAYGNALPQKQANASAQESTYAGDESFEERGSGKVLRFANKVPLLFDSTNCAITYAVRGIDWKRYGISDFDTEPINVMVNVSSVYIPYSGVGKQAISPEEEIINEIKFAVMEVARELQRYLHGVRNRNMQESKYKTIVRYISQLSGDLSELTGVKKELIEKTLRSLIDSKYKSVFEDGDNSEEGNDGHD